MVGSQGWRPIGWRQLLTPPPTRQVPSTPILPPPTARQPKESRVGERGSLREGWLRGLKDSNQPGRGCGERQPGSRHRLAGCCLRHRDAGSPGSQRDGRRERYVPGWRGRVCGGVVSWSLSHDVCVWDWRGSYLCISLCVLCVYLSGCVSCCFCDVVYVVCVYDWAHPSTLC